MLQKRLVRIDWREVVRFLDEMPKESVGHATGVVGVLGEDLGAAAFKHCVEANGSGEVRLHSETVKGVGKKGPWLDRWIEVDSWQGEDMLLQAEVKSSSAHATNGKILRIDIRPDELEKMKRFFWHQEWDDRAWSLKHPATGKVLVRMQPKSDFGQRKQLPLLIFWKAMAPDFGGRIRSLVPGGHLFTVDKPKYGVPGRVPTNWPEKQENFEELWVFSVRVICGLWKLRRWIWICQIRCTVGRRCELWAHRCVVDHCCDDVAAVGAGAEGVRLAAIVFNVLDS